MSIKNRDIALMWATKREDRGRGSNLFFEKDKIYSYGLHYLLAKMFDTDIGVVALVNRNNYSPSTERHKSYVVRALYQENIKYIYADVPNPKGRLDHEYNLKAIATYAIDTKADYHKRKDGSQVKQHAQDDFHAFEKEFKMYRLAFEDTNLPFDIPEFPKLE